mmetsp:Transcript_95291/g.188867  ORF Transcript_95291/g.188867 Transcript_95291/m.188867 type:complete len:222 (+) Transcript_95291:533-1198(+)
MMVKSLFLFLECSWSSNNFLMLRFTSSNSSRRALRPRVLSSTRFSSAATLIFMALKLSDASCALRLFCLISSLSSRRPCMSIITSPRRCLMSKFAVLTPSPSIVMSACTRLSMVFCIFFCWAVCSARSFATLLRLMFAFLCMSCSLTMVSRLSPRPFWSLVTTSFVRVRSLRWSSVATLTPATSSLSLTSAVEFGVGTLFRRSSSASTVSFSLVFTSDTSA